MDRGSKYLQAEFCSVLAGSEPGCHLLEWMYVVTEIAQGVTELLRIVLDEAKLVGDVDK
ncbi:hypothetical protein GCM10028792_13260 [Salinisphaera aquimarina]